MRCILLWGTLLIVSSCHRSIPTDVAVALEGIPSEINYNFHVKPILSDRCYACHGPDDEARQGDLRLDQEASATSLLESGTTAIKPGSLSGSSLFDRILSEDPEVTMPPPESKLDLSAKDKAVLIRWIEQGAAFEPHWSFIKPSKKDVPPLQDGDRGNNAIDAFILKGLRENGLQASPPADKERLLRRTYMDLTGLPPSSADMDAFLANEDPEAFEKVVDQLLISEDCAERLTMEWMDVARYADSHGLHADGWRSMWPWRDWVIKAFHQHMPFDRFITLQLAGDLLPNAGREEVLATAFHRNHPMTAEGGVIDEEFRLEYVADRTNTTATALMGLTMECAKCHDHKFDPVSQKDYYQLSAFFNNQRELGMTGDDGNYGPMLTLEAPSTRKKLSALDRKIFDINEKIKQEEKHIRSMNNGLSVLSRPPNINRGMEAYFPLERLDQRTIEGKSTTVIDQDLRCTTAARPIISEGKVGKSLTFADEYAALSIQRTGKIELHQPLSVGLWINTVKKKKDKTQVLIGNAGNKNEYWRGWDFYLDQHNRLGLRLIHSRPHNMIDVKSSDSIPLHTWTHVAFRYDGSADAQGCRLYINGQQVEVRVAYNQLNKSILPIRGGSNDLVDRPLLVSKSYRSFTGDNGIFQGRMDEIRIYRREVSALEIAEMAGHTPAQQPESIFLDQALLSSIDLKELKSKRSSFILEAARIRDTIQEIMVMEEMPQPRATFVLNRGQYDAPREQVSPTTPEEILPFPDEYPPNRLGLAQWLFHPDHPLTARTTVNRYWQMIFGKGIVKTTNDFGNQGSLPTHPELLDWLALELIENGWDIHALLKMMVMSATYQQSSVTTTAQRELDPENVYLARSPSYRWPAEMIRDNALSASGLLVKKIGGPSVKPYQPPGLWIEKGNFSHKLLHYVEDQGENLYRRSLYTFVKRTSPHPAMTIFDVPGRDVCTLTRESTNTPLQALVLLNDPQFVEAARVLAERIQVEGQGDIQHQARLAFRLVTSRRPTQREVEVLVNTYEKQLEIFQHDPSAARDLLMVGDYKLNHELSMIQTAALTVMSSNILNHDEAYMKR